MRFVYGWCGCDSKVNLPVDQLIILGETGNYLTLDYPVWIMVCKGGEMKIRVAGQVSQVIRTPCDEIIYPHNLVILR